MLKKIVSGGQTGADRAALDVAMDWGLEIGGWIPKGRLAEDGPISHRYLGLLETDSADPSVRTSLNVRDSDATLLVSHSALQGGSLLTLQAAQQQGRPVVHIDLLATSQSEASTRLLLWLRSIDPSTLNVAGPRASQDASIYASVSELLQAVLPLVSKPN
jgi:putative molybdenum carrier protein